MPGLMSLLRRKVGGDVSVPALPPSASDTKDLVRAAAYDKPALYWSIYAFQFGAIRYWPNPDEVLQKYGAGEGVAFYRRIRQQVPYVPGLFGLRIDSVMALPHNWVAGDPDNDESVAVRDVVDEAWKNTRDRDAAVRKLLFCIADGIAFGELVWSLREIAIKPKKPKTAPKPKGMPVADPTDPPETPVTPPVLRVAVLVPQIIDRRTDHFFFDADGGVHFKTLGQSFNAPVLDQLQVIVARYGSAELHGDGVMREIYADIWKIDTIDKMALRALEKQGYPLLKVTVPEAWTTDQVDRFRASIATSYPNFVVYPFGDKIDFSFPDQTSLVTYLGRDQIDRITKLQDTISIGILGVSFSTSDKGSRARDQVRNELRFEKTAGDSGSYDQIANDWADKVCQVNYPSLPEYLRPRMVTDHSPTGDLVAFVNMATALKAMGFKVSVKQMSETTGMDVAQTPEDTLSAPAAPAGGVAKPIPGQSTAGENPTDITVMSENGELYHFDSAEEFRLATGL